jgi:four helix bundle protein
MQDFRNLKVWQRAHELALWTYRLTADFPKDELFGLRHSMRKAATDIPAFIAEGSGRENDAELSRSISAALGVATRLEYYALMAKDLEFIGADASQAYEAALIELKKMLIGFNRRLR